MALETLGIRPDIFVLLDVPEELLVERVVGIRSDHVTGKIYHLKYSPPENEEIASRLTQRFDDTEEKVKLRLLPSSSFPGGDVRASGGSICPVFAQLFAGDERILQINSYFSGDARILDQD